MALGQMEDGNRGRESIRSKYDQSLLAIRPKVPIDITCVPASLCWQFRGMKIRLSSKRKARALRLEAITMLSPVQAPWTTTAVRLGVEHAGCQEGVQHAALPNN